jgi:hypothetical protein
MAGGRMEVVADRLRSEHQDKWRNWGRGWRMSHCVGALERGEAEAFPEVSLHIVNRVSGWCGQLPAN